MTNSEKSAKSVAEWQAEARERGPVNAGRGRRLDGDAMHDVDRLSLADWGSQMRLVPLGRLATEPVAPSGPTLDQIQRVREQHRPGGSAGQDDDESGDVAGWPTLPGLGRTFGDC